MACCLCHDLRCHAVDLLLGKDILGLDLPAAGCGLIVTLFCPFAIFFSKFQVSVETNC